MFVAGIDLLDAASLGSLEEEDIARRCKIVYKHIKAYQESFTAIEKVDVYFCLPLCLMSAAKTHPPFPLCF